MKYCDTTRAVVRWSSESIIIPYIKPTDNRPHRYFPDFYIEVESNDGNLKRFLIEIKPKVQANPPKPKKRKTQRYLTEIANYAINQAKWVAAERYCKERQWTFLVLTEDHLFDKPNARR